MNKKKVFLILTVLLVLSGIIFCFTQKGVTIKNREFIEKALSPIKVTRQDDRKRIKSLLNDTFYQSNFIEYGMSENGSSKYSLEKIMYIYCFIKKIDSSNQARSELQRMIRSLEKEYEEGYMSAIDELAYIVLNNMFSPQDSDENIENYIHKHIDEKNGLLFENTKKDEYIDKVSFTVEVIKICNEAGIEIDTEIFKDAMYDFLRNYEFLPPEEGQTLFNSGGLPIYAVNVVDDEYDLSEYRSWYTKWKIEKQEGEIDNWDTYLDVYSSFLPVAKAFGDEKEVKENIKKFLTTENVREFIETSYDETFAFNFFINEIEQLNNESKSLLSDVSSQSMEYYVDKLRRPTLKSNYYGAELAYVTDYTYDETRFYKNCDKVYMESSTSFLETANEEDIKQFVEDTYYYLLIRFTADSLEKNSKSINEEHIQEAVLECMDLITTTAFNDPSFLRMFCESLSYLNMEISYEFKSYLTKYLEEYSSNAYIANSEYLGDLFIIDRILGTNIISVEMMEKSMYNLSVNGMFKFELADQTANIETTFLMYSIMMNYGLLEGEYKKMKQLDDYRIDCSTLEQCYITSCLQYMMK